MIKKYYSASKSIIIFNVCTHIPLYYVYIGWPKKNYVLLWKYHRMVTFVFAAEIQLLRINYCYLYSILKIFFWKHCLLRHPSSVYDLNIVAKLYWQTDCIFCEMQWFLFQKKKNIFQGWVAKCEGRPHYPLNHVEQGPGSENHARDDGNKTDCNNRFGRSTYYPDGSKADYTGWN